MTHRWFPAMGVLALQACSLLNHIEACELTPAPEVQVNSLPERDEATTDGRSVARLASGQIVAVWSSTSQSRPELAGQIRARILHADGTPAPNCMGVAEVRVDTADEVVGRPAVAVGSAADSPVYIAWQASPAGVDPNQASLAVRARILTNRLCPPGAAAGVLTVSDPSDSADGHRAFAPSVAARPDGREAVVTYVSGPIVASPLPHLVRFRPLGISRNISGSLLQNGCDASDRACTLATGTQVGRSAMTPSGEGYRVAWPTRNTEGWSLQTVTLGADTAPSLPPRELATTQGPNIAPNVTLAADGSGFLMAWDAPVAPTTATRSDSNIWLRRFDAQSAPLRSAVRVNTSDGRQVTPSAALSRGGVLVAWVDSRAGLDVRARLLDAADQPLFTGLACGDGDFRLSSLEAGARQGVSLVASAPGTVLAVFADSSLAGNDPFGYAVRARLFDLARLAPAAR